MDQNFNYLNINTHKPTSDLLNIFMCNGFLPTVTLPSRITEKSSTLIDNVYIKTNTYNFSSKVIISDLSDHLPILVNVAKSIIKKK